MYKVVRGRGDITLDDCEETAGGCMFGLMTFEEKKTKKKKKEKNNKNQNTSEDYPIDTATERDEEIKEAQNPSPNQNKNQSHSQVQTQINKGETERKTNAENKKEKKKEGKAKTKIEVEVETEIDVILNKDEKEDEMAGRKSRDASPGKGEGSEGGEEIGRRASSKSQKNVKGSKRGVQFFLDEKSTEKKQLNEREHVSSRYEENENPNVESHNEYNQREYKNWSKSDETYYHREENEHGNEEHYNNREEKEVYEYENEEEEEENEYEDTLYDQELNDIIDKAYFDELIPSIPHDILGSYIKCLKKWGFERQVQLHRLINLIGDLRDPISVIQILGLPGMGKTRVVKHLIKSMNVPYAYVNCLMAVYQTGRSARNVIYHTILKDLSIHLLKEFNEYKNFNNITNYIYDPTKLIPNTISSTDSFFSLLHKLLSFKPEDENVRNAKKGAQKKKNVDFNKLKRSNQHYKDKLYDRSVVFILDNIRYLVRTHPDLFYALTRIHEYIKGPYNDLTKANQTTRGLCVILINRSPLPDEIFDGLPQPPTVWFDTYSAENCKNILYRLYDTMCFEGLLTINDKDLKIHYAKNNRKEFLVKRKNVILENDVIYDLWCRYVEYIINVCYKDYKSDFHELLFITSHMWPLFIKPIIDGTLEPIVENMNTLQRNIDTHIRVATYNHASHFTFELTDSVFLNETNLKNKIDLSFYSKILLVGAYLASRNLPLSDKRFFNATVKGGAFTLPKKRKKQSKNDSILTLIGQAIPKNFTFIRWICITDCLLVCFFDEQLVLNSLVCQQINILIQLGFITFSSSTNLSCLVRNSLMNGVQWSGFCGTTLLNTTNNFSSIANTVFSESGSNIGYDTLDPYTKLAIQVPEEIIKNISKELKIPLDELIL